MPLPTRPWRRRHFQDRFHLNAITTGPRDLQASGTFSDQDVARDSVTDGECGREPSTAYDTYLGTSKVMTVVYVFERKTSSKNRQEFAEFARTAFNKHAKDLKECYFQSSSSQTTKTMVVILSYYDFYRN